MDDREIAIKISNVKKKYRLGEIGGTTLQEAVQSFSAKILGREDPNTKLGTNQYVLKKEFMALNGIDLTIYKGEAIGIIGCNGAGKSTLLKILSRITAPTEGEIDIYGRVTSMLEVGTGFNGEMTGRENIYMNGAILGMTKEEIDSKIEEIIAFSEVGDFIDTPVKRYSSGMYVKLAFAVAAHLDSEIMIMDEVLAVGDMKFQKKCLGRMGDVTNNEGKTILYVSHNMETIRQFCTRCVVLKQGSIIFDGDVENAIDVYMDNQGETGKIFYDYVTGTEQLMRSGSMQRGARIHWVKLLNKKSAIYSAGEAIMFDVKIVSQREFQHLRFRFEVRYGDGTPVGTMPDLDLGTMLSDESKVFRMCLDTSLFTRGIYQVCLVLFEKNDLGTFDNYDVILPAFIFEIQDKIEIAWDTSRWGHIRLPDFTCEAISEDQYCNYLKSEL